MSELQRTVDHSFEDTIERVTATLGEQGFGVLTTIEVDKVLKKKLDADFRPYTILGACNPGFALQALQHDLDVGTLLPCNVVVHAADDGRTTLRAVDPLTLLPSQDPEMVELANQVRKRIAQALADV